MRRRGARIAALALGLLLVAVASTTAAVNARLGGKFETTVTKTDGDYPLSNGWSGVAYYKYKALCDSGPCKFVQIARYGSSGTVLKTKLEKVDPGVYKGTEVDTDPVCADSSPAVSNTNKLTVKIVKKNAQGRATKVKGTSKLKTQGCKETFGDFKFVGVPAS